MTETWVCVIGGGRSQVPFIEAAATRGLSTVAFDVDPNAPARHVATEFVAISTHDPDGVVAHLDDHSRDLVGCFTYSSYEGALLTTAAVVDHFGLRGLTSESLARTTSKLRMRERLAAAGLAVPEWEHTSDPAALEAFRRLHGAVMVKPGQGSVGSAGVALIDDATPDPAGLFAEASRLSSDGLVIVERFLEGDEYSVDGYVIDGEVRVLAVSRKHPQGDHFVIGGYVTGDGAVPAALEAGLDDLTRTVLPTLALDNSYLSLDVIEAEGDLFVIDAGPLLDAKVDRLLHHAGVDVYGIAADIALGQVPDLSAFGPGVHGLRFLYTDRPATLLRAEPGRFESAGSEMVLEMEKVVGDSVRSPRSVSDILGWVCTTGSDPEQVWMDLSGFDYSGRIELGGPA